MSLSSFRSGGRKFTLPLTSTIYPPAEWVLSSEHISKKSVFVARCAKVGSVDEALGAVKSLFGGNRKVQKATHNMLAYRIREAGELKVDSDDDGEAGAGARVLGVLEAMEVEGAVVCVTRRYGGVKLGGERFRLITASAKEAVVLAGLGKEERGGRKER